MLCVVSEDTDRVIGERRILRCAHARVIEAIPWVTAHGERRFIAGGADCQ